MKVIIRPNIQMGSKTQKSGDAISKKPLGHTHIKSHTVCFAFWCLYISKKNHNYVLVWCFGVILIYEHAVCS
jgi:hypothetical protein